MWRRRNFICHPADLVLWSADVTSIRSPGAAIASVCVLVASLLAGCSTSDGVGSFIVDPGHYSVYHCDGLAARLKVLLAREQELANLMNRASEGGGGVLIGNLAYRTDYENVVGEEKVLRRAAAEKNANYPCQPSLSRPLQPRTRRSLRQLPHRSFKAIRPSADQPS
jgi:predicted small secreted protein